MEIFIGVLFFVTGTLFALAKYFNKPWIIMVAGVIVMISFISYPYIATMGLTPEYFAGGNGREVGVVFMYIACWVGAFSIGLGIVLAGANMQRKATKKVTDKKSRR
ncbi:MAG: hypothetical protein KA066_02120 [Candidatus Pacebacteria bacterium]|nr:hypothetical protein [Candidatus Paceibacterota bacterium]